MASAILAIIFIIILFFSVSLQRVFSHQSPRDLKRRARRGDTGAKKLYELAAHGNNLLLLLWILVVVSAALSFVFLGELFSFWPALIFILMLVWLSFVWLPNSKVSQLELATTGWIAPALEWLLDLLHRPLASFDRLIGKLHFGNFHTGIYDRNDLIKLLATQKSQPQNQIDHRELDMALAALEFEDKTVEQIMTPRRSLTAVNAKDKITPKLIDELHRTGASRFVVYEGKQDNIVGTIRLEDLVDLKKFGNVESEMNHKVCYVHEDFNLRQVLDAFYKTRQHLFIVVNRFEDFVGTVALEEVLAEIVGPVTTEFDNYHDLSAVARAEAEATHIAREAAGTEPTDKNSPEYEVTVLE